MLSSGLHVYMYIWSCAPADINTTVSIISVTRNYE